MPLLEGAEVRGQQRETFAHFNSSLVSNWSKYIKDVQKYLNRI